MRNKLKKVFERNDFDIIEYKKSDFFINKKKSENYILYYIDNLFQSNIDSILEDKVYDNEIEFIDKEHKKNTSVIFIVKVNNFELNDEEKNIVFQIEEDPYFYKKYVLWYTEKEIENIDKYLDNITNKIIDKNLFESMKKLMEGNDTSREEEINEIYDEVYSYMLLCRMIIKIPFLSLKNIYKDESNNELIILNKNIELITNKYDELNKKINENTKDLNIDIDENEIEIYWEEIKKEIKKDLNWNIEKGEFLWDTK